MRRATTSAKRRTSGQDKSGVPGPVEYEVALVADMTSVGESAFRIAGDVRRFAASDLLVALVHLPSAAGSSKIAPDIQGTVTSGIADPVDPAESVRVGTAILYDPHLLTFAPSRLGGLRAQSLIIVADRVPTYDPVAVADWFRSVTRVAMWAPTNAEIRAALTERYPDLVLTETNWLLPSPSLPEARPDRLEHRMVIGQIGGSGHWPSSREEMLQLFPPGGGFDVRLLGFPPADLTRQPHGWTVIDPGAMSVDRFLEQLDALVYYPADADVAATAIIAEMLAAGRLVLLPPYLEANYGRGPVYVAAPEVTGTLRRYVADPVIRRGVHRAATSAAGRFFGPAPIAPVKSPLIQARREKPQTPVALFLSSNGTGMGHVTRLLAVARRLKNVEPVFVSMAQAIEPIESFGYTAEYVSSANYLGVDPIRRDGWFRAELEHLIDAYNASIVVYDGNAPTDGLIQAVGSRGGCRLVWLRGGMIGSARMPLIENSRYCDLIIEPGEVASEVDHGITSFRRSETVLVDPILLLDPPELLPPSEARQLLGLDPSQTAVLVQLGSGSNRDIVKLVDEVVTELARLGDVQVAIAEWASALELPPLWAGHRILRGYPFAQYYPAFDFTVSAAGYNTFHEVLAYGIPSVFIANTHGSMDDQASRARYAEQHDLALEIDEGDLLELPAMLKVLMAGSARDYLRDNCRKLAIKNGAGAAAELIERQLQRERRSA